MAMSVLRNASKLNVANLMKSARITPAFKAYTTLVNNQRNAIVKPLTPLVKNFAPPLREISLTAPKKMSAGGGNYSQMWTIERAVAIAMLGLLPTAFLIESQTIDALMVTAIVMHAHWGLEAIVLDYVRPSVVGPILPKVAHGGLFLLSVITLGGLYYIIYNDIGVANTIKEFWSIKGPVSEEE